MAHASRADHEPDRALVHELIRVHGRRPTAEDLRRLLLSLDRSARGLSTRVRLGAARMVVRL